MNRPVSTPGRLRIDAAWIGKSNTSPARADYVGPGFERVAKLMEDLADYAARDNITSLLHAATTHAQFETIHRTVSLRSIREHNGPSMWRAPSVLDAIDRFAERAGRRRMG